MTAPESAAPAGGATTSDAPVSTLRGAGVDVDFRLVGRIVVALCLAALATLVIIFSVAGLDKNNQISQLHHHGVPVNLTVTGCLGLMGGSGSSPAGYSCTGTFSIDGARHSGTIPGIAFHRPGTMLRAVVVPSDPALFTPAAILAGEQTSWRVFLLPAILLVVLVALIVTVILWRRRARPLAEAGTPSPSA
jgi:hypothetical protein